MGYLIELHGSSWPVWPAQGCCLFSPPFPSPAGSDWHHTTSGRRKWRGKQAASMGRPDVPTGCIVWYGSTTNQDRQQLGRVVRRASKNKIIGQSSHHSLKLKHQKVQECQEHHLTSSRKPSIPTPTTREKVPQHPMERLLKDQYVLGTVPVGSSHPSIEYELALYSY